MWKTSLQEQKHRSKKFFRPEDTSPLARKLIAPSRGYFFLQIFRGRREGEHRNARIELRPIPNVAE